MNRQKPKALPSPTRAARHPAASRDPLSINQRKTMHHTPLSSLCLTSQEANHRALECNRIIREHAAASAVAAAIPIPGLDIAVDLGNMAMLHDRVVSHFGLSRGQIDQHGLQRKAVVLEVVRRQGCTFVGQVLTKKVLIRIVGQRLGRTLVARFSRYVPVVGTVAAAGITYAAFAQFGNAVVKECLRVHGDLRRYGEASE